MRNPVSDLWARMPAEFYRAFLVRFVLLLVFAGSVAVLCWNLADFPALDDWLENTVGLYRLPQSL